MAEGDGAEEAEGSARTTMMSAMMMDVDVDASENESESVRYLVMMMTKMMRMMQSKMMTGVCPLAPERYTH